MIKLNQISMSADCSFICHQSKVFASVCRLEAVLGLFLLLSPLRPSLFRALVSRPCSCLPDYPPATACPDRSTCAGTALRADGGASFIAGGGGRQRRHPEQPGGRASHQRRRHGQQEEVYIPWREKKIE